MSCTLLGDRGSVSHTLTHAPTPDPGKHSPSARHYHFPGTIISIIYDEAGVCSSSLVAQSPVPGEGEASSLTVTTREAEKVAPMLRRAKSALSKIFISRCAASTYNIWIAKIRPIWHF